MAPIKIDGTDITGATIDGTDVTEITVDGQTVFSASALPSSAIAQYDATQIVANNNDSINSWADTSGNANDLDSGSGGVYKTNFLDGSHPVVRTNSRQNSEFLQTSNFPNLSQPNTFFFAGRIQSIAGDANTVIDGADTSGDATNHELSLRNSTGKLSLQRGELEVGSFGNDTIVTGVYDGGSSKIRVDGVENTGGISSDTLKGITLGRSADGSNSTITHTGELLILNEAANTSTINEQESRLSAKFGIPI